MTFPPAPQTAAERRLESPDFPPFAEAPMTPAARRAVLMRDVDLVLDVGANRGQYAQWIRSFGYEGRIISFEPQSEPFFALLTNAESDSRWEAHNIALGNQDSEITLHVAKDSISTSALRATVEHLQFCPEAEQVAHEHVQIRTLAAIWDTLGCDGSLYMKVDVEGLELDVLRGLGEGLLRLFEFIELEVGLVPHYEDAPSFADVIEFMSSHSFGVVALEQTQGDDHSTGQMLMVEAIFRRDTG